MPNSFSLGRIAGLAAGVALMTSACVTSRLTPEAEAIRLTDNPEVVKGCTFIANVEGSDQMNGGTLGQGAAEENAMRRMRNQAAEKKANTLYVTRPDGTKFSGSHQRGEAYTCPSKAPG